MAGFSLLNSSGVRELASSVLFENIVQNILVIPGRSASFQYVEDVNAKTVSVNRVKMTGDARSYGQARNGGFFNASTGTAESQLFEIPLIHAYDTPIKVAKVQDDMSGGLALKGMLMNVPKSIARAINCTYFAELIVPVLNQAITATSNTGTVTYAISSSYVTKISADSTAGAVAGLQSAIKNLEDGDTSNGFDIFKLETSVVYGSAEFLNHLRGSANFIVNNPIGQQMISSGSFSAFNSEYVPNSIDGYQGEVYGMLLYRVGSLFKSALGYIGVETLSDNSVAAGTAGSLDNLIAIVVNGDAVGGGMTPGDIKVVDARGGQGWEIQPLARFGFSVFSKKGVQLITNSTGLDASKFKAYTGSGSTATQTTKAVIYMPGNRA